MLSVSLCLMPTVASAQRTTSGQGMLSFEGQWPHGVSISYGQYLPSSMWEAGAYTQYRTTPVNSDCMMEYMPAAVFGNWMYRLVGTRSRMFNLYAGAGAFLGWEFFDPWKTLPDFLSEEIGSGVFIYGINAKLQAEIFFTRRTAFLISGSAPMNFTSPCSWIQPTAAFGIRIDL